MRCLSFRGHTGSFVSPFLGVGVEVKQGGGCTYALGTAEVSLAASFNSASVCIQNGYLWLGR